MRAGIVCSGVSCVDLFLYGTEPLATRESLSMVRETQYRPGGATSNTGRALARLGLPVEYMTVIGADQNGDLLLRLWQDDGVDVRYVARTAEAGTALSTVPVYQDGRRGVYFYPGANALMSVDNLFGPERAYLSVLRERQAFHLGYPPLLPLLQGERLASLLALVRETGVFISLDTTPIPDDTSLRAMLAPALPHAHLLKVNIEEAAQITGCFSGLHARAQAARRDIETIVTHEEIYRIGAALLAMGVPMVVITLGPNGACLFTGSTDVLRATPLLADAPADWADQRIFVPAYQVDGPVNAAGAGDAFTAALLAGLCRGIPSLAQLARVAHATAALQVDLTRFACRFEDIIILLPTLRPRIPENPHLAEKGVN